MPEHDDWDVEISDEMLSAWAAASAEQRGHFIQFVRTVARDPAGVRGARRVTSGSERFTAPCGASLVVYVLDVHARVVRIVATLGND